MATKTNDTKNVRRPKSLKTDVIWSDIRKLIHLAYGVTEATDPVGDPNTRKLFTDLHDSLNTYESRIFKPWGRAQAVRLVQELATAINSYWAANGITRAAAYESIEWLADEDGSWRGHSWGPNELIPDRQVKGSQGAKEEATLIVAKMYGKNAQSTIDSWIKDSKNETKSYVFPVSEGFKIYLNPESFYTTVTKRIFKFADEEAAKATGLLMTIRGAKPVPTRTKARVSNKK